MPAPRFEAIVSRRVFKSDDDYKAVEDWARKKVMEVDPSDVIPIYDNSTGLVVAVVTDDANGVTVHKLETWEGEDE